MNTSTATKLEDCAIAIGRLKSDTIDLPNSIYLLLSSTERLLEAAASLIRDEIDRNDK